MKGEHGYGLFEVFYFKDKTVDGWTEDPLFGWFETKEELIGSLGMMYKDAKKRRKVLNILELSKNNISLLLP